MTFTIGLVEWITEYVLMCTSNRNGKLYLQAEPEQYIKAKVLFDNIRSLPRKMENGKMIINCDN